MAGIKTPFAQSGNRTNIPETDLSGNVNMQQGYTADYELEPGVDPFAKLIDRASFNGIFYLVTAAIKEVQERGCAPWFSTLAPYGLNTTVYHDNKTWRSTAISNSTTPGAVGANWIEVNSWAGLIDKPAFLAEGATAADARAAIGAADGSSSTWANLPGKPAVVASGADQLDARLSIGINNAMIADQASVSSNAAISNATTTHDRQVSASRDSSVSATCSQVSASETSSASGRWSQVNASGGSLASGWGSQVNASDGCDALTDRSQINASSQSSTSAKFAQINSSIFCDLSLPTGFSIHGQINSSQRVINSTTYSSVWGFGASGSASLSNQQIRLEANGGVGRFKGNTTTGGFDYAEYFPNLNSQIIPVGTIVTLDGDKVRTAQDGDFILGAVSETYGVLGNTADFCWHGREMRNEFGGVIKHDLAMVSFDDYDGLVSEAKKIPDNATYYTVNVPVENPSYKDQGRNYKARGDRKDEWTIVGLMGQVYVRVYENIENNSFVSAGGMQSESQTNLYCMTMTTPYSAAKGYGVAKCLIR